MYCFGVEYSSLPPSHLGKNIFYTPFLHSAVMTGTWKWAEYGLSGWPLGGGGTPREIRWGCAARFPKPLPYLWPKSAIFPTLLTWPKIRNPIYNLNLTCQNPVSDLHYNWISSSDQCKHNLWRAFVDFLSITMKKWLLSLRTYPS